MLISLHYLELFILVFVFALLQLRNQVVESLHVVVLIRVVVIRLDMNAVLRLFVLLLLAALIVHKRHPAHNDAIVDVVVIVLPEYVFVFENVS